MRKSIIFLCLVVMMAGNLKAGDVSQQMARMAGEKFLATTVLGEQKADIQLDLAYVAANRGEVDYYVFNNQGDNGFVIIAGDDRVKPVLAYATTGEFRSDNLAEGFAYTLASFQREIHYVREHRLAATPDIIAEWRSVMSTGALREGRSARSVVGPICQTHWNQNFPYNSQCPEDPEGSGGYVYAGCVATAMGQVMKFWDYPERGTGTYSYLPPGYPQQTANFGDTEYHFELMPLALDSTSTEEDYFYIAQFLHHCGISVDMQYSGHGSGAYSSNVPPALRDYFGYTCDDDEGLSFWGYYFYSLEEWAQMLKDGGLDENIPLYYSGADDNGAGGHAFVCDGYDENDYFHFNWGWSGRDDAWCPIGALNTTKYAFNDQNSFIGHIIPQNTDYYQRADSVAGFFLQETGFFDAVLLSWTNPSLNLQGETLTSIESVTIRRNGQVIATLTDVEAGASMSFEDEDLAPGLYEYAIFVTNTAGVSRTAYRSILVGEKCELTFELHDQGGDGWKGAAISVTAENGQRIAVIGMSDGSDVTVTVPLLKQHLNLIWNHGWFHTQEAYDTDFECAFTIRDAEGNELYVSDELQDGVFLSYENNCELAPLICYPVQNLHGEYQWHQAEEFGAFITWEKPVVTSYLHHFRVLRSVGAYKGDDLIAEIPFDGSSTFEYFDNMFDVATEATYYSVNCVYVLGEEECQSEYWDVLVWITDVTERDATVNVYPNPTTGLVNIQHQGTMCVTVSNVLGQKLLVTEGENDANIDLSPFGQGVFVLRVDTSDGFFIQKVMVQK